MLPKKKNVYSVAQINSYIRGMFSQDFLLNGLMVKGEVSNLTDHASGHLYFTLKDEKSAISCVMFASDRRGLSFPLREGMQVIVSGAIDVYVRDGKYQLYAKKIEKDGVGALAERFEQLKKELEERGMFDPSYKRPIPPYIRTLGVVTAPTGAAIRDIIQISKRRNPFVQIILYPAIVQGESAPASIIQGIHALEAMNVDVIIAGRGGGSLEDLWAFNEEAVAQAFFDCSVPIISAVGHETDVVLSDYVADLRAPTPSAAAELAVCDITGVFRRLEDAEDDLLRLMNRRIYEASLRVENLEVRLKARDPLRVLRDKRNRLVSLEERIVNSMQRKLTAAKHRLSLDAERLEGRSPLKRLSGGFVYGQTKEGEGLRSIEQISGGDRLKFQLTDGEFQAEVLEIWPRKRKKS